MKYSTFLGGDSKVDPLAGVEGGFDVATSVVATANGITLIGGSTSSYNFPTSDNALDRLLGSSGSFADALQLDAFLSVIDTESGNLLFSTFLGGDESETQTRVDVGGDGSAFIFGATGSGNFPAPFDTSIIGFDQDYPSSDERTGTPDQQEAYVAKIAGLITTSSGPEIDVRGGGTSIPDGDTSPEINDGTDFGSTPVASGTLTRTFTIKNQGTGTLILSGNPIVQVTGANSGDFTVIAQPTANSLGKGAETTFTIAFDPSGPDLRAANVEINNNDGDESPYNFSVQGTGAAGPEISVLHNGAILIDGVSPVNFGQHDVGSVPPTKTFTVTNDGDAVLTLGMYLLRSATRSANHSSRRSTPERPTISRSSCPRPPPVSFPAKSNSSTTTARKIRSTFPSPVRSQPR